MNLSLVRHRARFPLILHAVLLAACCVTPLRAIADEEKEPPDVSGTYEIAGTFSDSSTFTGTLELKKRLSVKWRKGPRYISYDAKMKYSTDWEGTGVATFMDNRLYLAIAKDMKRLSLVVYHPVVLPDDIIALRNEHYRRAWLDPNKKKDVLIEVKGDPWYSDIWWHEHYGVTFKADGFWAIDGLGPKHKGQKWPPLGDGDWSFHRDYYEKDGKKMGYPAVNSGRIVITSAGDGMWTASRYYWEGGSESFWDQDRKPTGDHNDGAVLMPDATTLVSVFNGDGSDAVAYYEIAGKTLVGKICDTVNPNIYWHTLTVPDNVVARNPGLFH